MKLNKLKENEMLMDDGRINCGYYYDSLKPRQGLLLGAQPWSSLCNIAYRIEQ